MGKSTGTRSRSNTPKGKGNATQRRTRASSGGQGKRSRKANSDADEQTSPQNGSPVGKNALPTGRGFDMQVLPNGRKFLDPTQEEYPYPASYVASEPLTTPHTVSALLLVLAGIVYAIVYREEQGDTASNTKTGLAVACGLGLVFAMEYFRDTLLLRPHPALWRLANGVAFFYMLLCAFSLFQNINDLRKYLTHIDDDVTGERLPDRSYGTNCEFTWENITGAVDEFVLAHVLGWWGKALVLRDPWLAWFLSFMFEIMEYSLTHYLPNFNECWWDHWLLDFLGCNAIGIIAAHWTLHWLNSREYNWNGIHEIPTISGKLSRGLQQFTPASWVQYEWKVFSDFKRFCAVTLLVATFLAIELNAFFLKALLYVPTTSNLNIYRLIIIWLIGCTALRDWYHYVTDPLCRKLGSSAWLFLAMLTLESLIVLKFGSEEWGHVPIPSEVVYPWAAFVGLFITAVVYWFGFALPAQRRKYEAVPTGQ